MAGARQAAIHTEHRGRGPALPRDFEPDVAREIADLLNGLVADVFTLYVKTKNFHWHVSGLRFRDLHLMLDEQAQEVLALSDPLAERVRKIGGQTIHSLAEIMRRSSLEENETDFVSANDMLLELMMDNKALAGMMREAHAVCDEHEDLATASMLEEFIDHCEKRTWFLFEASRAASPHLPAS